MEIPWHDNLQGRAWRKMWRKVQRKSAAKSAAKNTVKDATKNSTAEKQLFVIYHDCFHFGPGTLLATGFLDPFSPEIWQCRRLSLSAVQTIVERNAAECAKGFHPLHSWCCCDLKQALTMTCGRIVAGLYGEHSQGLTFAPLRVEAELSCVQSLAPRYILQI